MNVQADAPFRMDAETVKQLKVRNADGDMVPLGAVVDVRESAGPVTITRYNMFPAATITGSWQPGVSTGDVLRTMERLSDQELPRSMTYEWTELSYLQKQASKIEQFRDLRQNPFSAFVLGAVLVFFVLAGLYESWSTPLAVILVVPMCLLSALAGIAFRGMDVNIFVQIGFVVLVGLACKNAILIVEFAKQQRELGKSRRGCHRYRRGNPAAADPDDLGVLHPHGAAVLRCRRRRRDAPLAGHCRPLGRLRGDALRHLPDAGVLLRGGLVDQPKGPARRGADRDDPGSAGTGRRRA